MTRLANRVALVTGSSRGIGEAVALALGREGAQIVVNARTDHVSGQAVADRINRAGGNAIYLGADVSEPDQVEQLFKQIEAEFGTVEILVNNVGLTEAVSFAESTKSQWQRTFDMNVIPTVLCSQRAVPNMLKHEYGAIINTSSIRGNEANGRPGTIAYSAAKAAVSNFSRTLAKELAPHITVNAIAPGFVATEYITSASEEEIRNRLANVPLGRLIEPAELAELYVQVATARYLTGSIIYADGGVTLGQERKA